MQHHRIPTAIKSLKFRDRETWLSARGKDVTASVVGALFDVHEYSSPYELWAEKSGRLPREDLDNVALERGELLEPVAVELMRRRRPEWEIFHNTGEATTYLRDPVNRIGATPDTFVMCPERGPGTVQIKSVEQTTYRRKWTPEGADPEPPLWIAMQATLEAHMTGSRWACVAPLVVGYGLDLPLIDIPLVVDVVDAIQRKSREFWDLVDSGQEPPPDYSRDRAVIEAMYPGDNGEEIDLVSDRAAYRLIEERSALLDKRDEAQTRLDEIDTELKYRMKGASLAYLPGGLRMTWRTQRRTFPDGKTRTFRVLRVPRPADLVLPPVRKPAPEPAPKPRRNQPWNF